MTKEMKFAWAYLLTHGKVTNGKWSYYGGCWESVIGDCCGSRGSEREISLLSEIKDKCVSVGIDWKKTSVPEVRNESEFMDTFSPSRDCLATIGTLYLMNGEKYLIGSSDDDAAHLAETARNLLQGTSGIEDLANML